MKIPFTKFHATGHSYALVDPSPAKLAEPQLPDVARSISDMATGIGSDGIILLHASKTADVGIRIFNRDGYEVKICGNGLRCAAKYAFENELVSRNPFHIETKTKVAEAEVAVKNGKVNLVTINMGKPDLRRVDIPMMGNDDPLVINETFVVAGEKLKLTAVSMGKASAVFFMDDTDEAPLRKLGPLIEKDRRFPELADVVFAEVFSVNEIHVRIWERRFGIKKACGTNACAAVVAASLNGFLEDGKPVTVHMPGGKLEIAWDDQGDVRLTGDAVRIAAGSYYFPG